jgi:hypothetical protein
MVDSDWIASVTQLDPSVHVYLGSLHRGDQITPYQRDQATAKWSSVTEKQPADDKLNKTFEWLCAKAEEMEARELQGRWGKRRT